MKLAASLLVLVVFSALTITAQEWTRFRGPNGTGISHSKAIPTAISEGDVNWKVELPGTGHSSPVLWGDRIFLTSTGDKAGGITIICLSARNGELLWKKDFSLTPFRRHQHNSFASSTPTVDGDRVYVVWNEPEHYMLTALTHDGKEVWQRDFGPFVSQHGCGTSPILYDGKVILGNEQDSKEHVKETVQDGVSSVLAVDAKTGKTLWQTPRSSAVVAYSTPCVYDAQKGKTAILFNSQAHGIYAVDPNNGKVLWEYDKAFDKRSVSSPIFAGNIIYGSCGAGGGGNFVTAIKAPGQSGATPELAYQIKQSAPYVPTGIALGDRAWFLSDAGVLSMVDAPTGRIRYQERVGGNYFGSPIWIDGRLFAVSTSGELVVIEASEHFKVLHRFPLRELCHSSPAVALGRLFVRTEKHLWCFGGGREVSGE